MPTAFHHLIKKPKINKNKKKKKNKKQIPKCLKTLNPQIQQQPQEPEEKEKEIKELGFKLKPSSTSSRTLTIQPLGNLYRSNSTNIRNPGLGSLQIVPDDLILDLLSLLDPKTLALLSAASKSLYVFATHDPLWRNLVLDRRL